MRKTTSRIARLTETVRTEINQKLEESWPYKMIREWLFGQTAGRDVPALELKAGDSYSLVWARGTKTAEHAVDACEHRCVLPHDRSDWPVHSSRVARSHSPSRGGF